MNTGVETEIARTLARRAEGDVDATALRSGALTVARRVRRRRRFVAGLTATVMLVGVAGAAEIVRHDYDRNQSAEQRRNEVPALPTVDVPGALQRPDTVATDPSVIHFDVDAAALHAVEVIWRSVWTQESVSIRTADSGDRLIHFTISNDPVHWRSYPALNSLESIYRYPPPPEDIINGRGRDLYRPLGYVGDPRTTTVGATGTINTFPDVVDPARTYYQMIWNPVPGLFAMLEMVADNPETVVRTSRAFRLDRSQRCAAPGTAGNAPDDARFYECETSLRAPDADGAFWNYSIITYSARSGNFLDVLFGTFSFPQPFTADRTVNGRPARWNTPVDGRGGKLEVPDEPGRQLIVSVRSWNFTEAEVQRVAEAFQFSGDPRDITTWPTNPVR